MRGWLIIAMVGAALTSASAQARGVVHASPARASHSASARPPGAFRSSSGFARNRIGPNRIGPNRNRPLFFDRRPHFSNRRHRQAISPLWYSNAYPYYPYLPFGDTGGGYDPSGAGTYDPYDQGDQPQQGELNQLRDEVEHLRGQRVTAPPIQQASPQERERPEGTPLPLTTLVFRDGTTQQVQNYAIAGETLWVINARRTRKILISELNVPATQKANEERGSEFALPQ